MRQYQSMPNFNQMNNNNNNNNQMPTNAMNTNQYVNANKQLLSRTGDQNISNGNISNVNEKSKINPKKQDTKRKRNEIDSAQEEILMND